MKPLTRRHFLHTTAAALLGAATQSRAANPPDTCGLGIGTYGLQSMSLAESIDLVARTGFNSVDLFVAPGYNAAPEILTPAGRKTLRKQITDSGLRLEALIGNLQPSTDPARQNTATDEFKRVLELANDLDTAHPPPIQTVLGGKDWEKSKALFTDTLAEWNELAAAAKVVLTIKPHRSHAMSTPAHAIEIFNQLGKPSTLRMVYDYSHYAFRDLSIADTVASALPWTLSVAVKDVLMVEGKTRFTLPGEGGSWDNAEIIRRFHAGGYRGEFSCEVSSQIWRGDPTYEPIAATQTCFDNMAAAFQRAGISRG